MRALITGATGFVGRRLLEKLDQPAVVLSRNADKAKQSLSEFSVDAFAWDPKDPKLPEEAFEGVDAVFHLAGEPVAEGRWNSTKKARIRASRSEGTRHLAEAIAKLSAPPKVLVSASAVGYYGDRGEETLTEKSDPGEGFLVDVCKEWEDAAAPAKEAGVHVVHPRIGIVLGPGGGALSKMLTPFKMGVGSPLGSGKQWMPWIHIDDLVGMMLFAADNEQAIGPWNGAAPQPETNRQFTKVLGKALKRPTFFPPVPGFMLRLMLGEFSQVLLASQRVAPQAVEAAGYKFQYPDLESALQDIV